MRILYYVQEYNKLYILLRVSVAGLRTWSSLLAIHLKCFYVYSRLYSLVLLAYMECFDLSINLQINRRIPKQKSSK